ncbi:MAG: hypothetical protein ACO4AJ_08950 [Prochlorothrix sp.]
MWAVLSIVIMAGMTIMALGDRWFLSVFALGLARGMGQGCPGVLTSLGRPI